MELPPGARTVLTGPDFLARQLAARAGDRQQAWLLRRPKAVRRNFLEVVIDGAGSQERWMLLQHDEVCGSYVEDVLEHEVQPDRRAMWLLRQPSQVRRSYVEEVLDAGHG